MSFFESGGTDSSWRRSDDAFSRLRQEHRRKRVVAWSVVCAVVAVVLSGVVVVVGPENVASATRQLFAGEPAPPSAEVIAVADKSFLTEEGRDLLYASRPTIAPLEQIAEACERPVDDPPTGCFAPMSGIFIYQPADARVADWAVTTLAHELLHAAYNQLGEGELFGIHDMLEAEIARVPADDPVHKQIEWSVGEEEGSRETELFAYLGSQVLGDGGFAPGLEEVYARYFTDRAALVNVHHRVDGVIDGMYTEVNATYQAVIAVESANANERAQIDADRQSHERARSQYNVDADEYNQMPESERGRWQSTWNDLDGSTHTAPLGESLERRLAALESYRVDLDARAAALAAAEASALTQRAAADTQYADLVTLLEEAYPGETFE